jgi:hypothetical protein
MKQLILTTLAVAAAASAFGQGEVLVNNTDNNGLYGGAGGSAANPSYSAAVTQNGLIFTTDTTEQAGNFTSQGGPVGSTLIGEDFSWALYGGTSSSSLSLLVSQTGTAIVGDNANWGNVADTADIASIPGSTSGSTVYLELYVWEGSTYTTYDAAKQAGDYVGDSGVFQQLTGGGSTPASTLTGLPDVLVTVPEPGTMALAALGGASLLLFRRKK